MNNPKEKFEPKKEILESLNKLLEENPDKFCFLKEVLTSIINREKIEISMKVNEDTSEVLVSNGEYMYKQKFDSIEKAKLFASVGGIN
ncbi:MAG: hypothetical protein RR942_13850 [Romboutsia sp.]